MTKKKIIKKRVSKVIKTRNAGSMTEAAFFSFIKNCLRNKSRYWKPISLCKQNAKRPYKGSNKRQKVEFLCNKCKCYFSDKEVNVDHIIPVGSLKTFADLPGIVERLFCEVENLQVLCKSCHTIKSKLDVIKIRKNG